MKIIDRINPLLIQQNKLFIYQLKAKLGLLSEEIPAYLSTMDVESVDRDFYYQYLYYRKESPYINDICSINTDDYLTEDQMKTIMISIYRKYNEKWKRIYRALVTEVYNPIENYNMSQIRTPNLTISNTGSSKTRLETNVTNKVNSYNSITPTTTTTGDTVQSGNSADNEVINSETQTGTEQLTRSGNIGVTTSAQMIKGEIDTRELYNFYEILYKDIVKEICLSII